MQSISRREMLRLAAAGAALAVLPRPTLRASASTASVPSGASPNAGIYRFRVGDFAAAALLTGFMNNVPAQPFVAPQATAEEFRSALAAASISGRFRLPFNVLLLQRGQEKILIDSGPGGKPAPGLDLLAHLTALGVAPTQITAVLLTHAHFDHLGGLLDEQDRVVFSQAEHFCMPEEIDFWTAKNPDFSRMRMGSKSALAQARRVFEHVPFTRIGPNAKLPEGLTPLLAPGHTPGHMTVRVESQGESLYHIVDLTHYARLMLPHPEWTIASDVNEAQAAATRRRIFTDLAVSRTRVFGSHVPYPGLGGLRSIDTGFEWVPEDWITES